MIIKSMRANFGCLKNAELALDSGLNVVEAPNESGKSTWSAFLRCMLYGADSVRRSGLTDKQRYAPWDGSPMEGQLRLEYEGRDITLYRRSLQGAAPMRDFVALYAGSGESVSGLGGSDAGEVLTGFSQSVFERSAFVCQGAMVVENSPELEKRLSSLLTAGEESASFADAEQRLRAWQRLRRSRGRGHIPQLEAEITSIRTELDQMEVLEAELARLETAAEKAGEVWKDLFQAGEREVQRRQSQLNAAQRELRQLEAAAREAERSCGSAPTEPPGLGSGLWLLWALIIFASVAALFFEWLWALIPLAVGMLGAIWDVMRLRQQRGAQQRYEQRREHWEQSHALAARRWREVELAAAELKELESELQRPDPEQSAAIREAEQQFRSAREACAEKVGELKSRGDRLVLETRLAALETELHREEERFAALELALAELQGAYEELQSRFSPMLARRTAELFERLTGDRYTEVLLQRSLSALVQRRGDSVPHESTGLSSGALAQLYLSLRLALLELLDEDGHCPLILDDAFASFDTERLRLALELLLEESRRRQIILFTCQSRERHMLEEIKDAD